MNKDKKGVPLRFEDRVYAVQPDFNILREIEEELGGLPALQGRFSGDGWKVSDLVTLTHIMLQAAGKTIDYVLLGNRMVREGLDLYLPPARSFLQLALHSK